MFAKDDIFLRRMKNGDPLNISVYGVSDEHKFKRTVECRP